MSLVLWKVIVNGWKKVLARECIGRRMYWQKTVRVKNMRVKSVNCLKIKPFGEISFIVVME